MSVHDEPVIHSPENLYKEKCNNSYFRGFRGPERHII